MAKTTSVDKKEFDDLRNAVFEFIKQYELDMRGDNNVSNGNPGIVNTIRSVKKYIEDYPSIAYLLAKKPLPTIGIGVGVWLVIATLYQFGLLKIIANVFGVELP